MKHFRQIKIIHIPQTGNRMYFLCVLLLFAFFTNAQDIELNGTISAESHQIKNVMDPTDAQDAVTKNYTYSKAEVDALVAAAVSNLQSQINALTNSETETITDVDGNTYRYLTFGTQTWTVEDAVTETYSDGTPIPQVTNPTEWYNLNTGAWCYYNNDPTKGKLYNWYAVMGIHDNEPWTPNKKFAPEGWHVSSNDDWTELQDYLIANGYNYDGTTTGNKIAKSMASTSGWQNSANLGEVGNNKSTNNSSGFNAFAKGNRSSSTGLYSGGPFTNGSSIYFWTSTEYSFRSAWSPGLSFNSSELYHRSFAGDKQSGFSVRFVKD